MNSENADLNWLLQQLRDRIGLTHSEAGDIVRKTMIAGQLRGLAPNAMCLPKMSVRSHITEYDGVKIDFVIPSELWKFIDIDWDEINPCYNFHTDQDSWIIHRIFINRRSAINLLETLTDSIQRDQTLSINNLKNPANNRHKGGRPPIYDWQKCQIEAERWMTQNGRPATFTELYKHMALWFGKNEPAESTLKGYLRPIYRNFK